MIEISHLTKRFGRFTAVDDLSFQVQPGEVLGFLGPNGAGKSTTMKMVTGFLPPTEGLVRVAGHDIVTDAQAAKACIGYLPEGAPLYPDMTPRSIMRFAGRLRRMGRAHLSDRMKKVTDLVDLGSVLDQPIETLSKGFKRRVGLGLAILHDPQVLILDEPTDGLDPNQKHHVRDLIRSMSAGKVIILSTHILEEVEAVCTRAMIVSEGQVRFDGTPKELRSMSRYAGAIEIEVEPEDLAAAQQALGGIAGVASIEDVELGVKAARFTLIPTPTPTPGSQPLLDAVRDSAQTAQWTLKSISVDRGRMDDVFRSVTTSQAVPVPAIETAPTEGAA